MQTPQSIVRCSGCTFPTVSLSQQPRPLLSSHLLLGSHILSISFTHSISQYASLTMLLTLFLSPYTLVLFLVQAVLYYILPYLRNWQIRSIPAPFPAAFTSLWLLWQARQGRRYLAVDAAHKKYGALVRIQPNHVSVADPEAIPQIYGHGNGFLKR